MTTQEAPILFGTDCIARPHLSTNADGYPFIRVGRGEAKISAARAVYRLFVGDIPSGKMVLHHCDNRMCINPAHLYLLGASAEPERIKKAHRCLFKQRFTPEDYWYIRRSRLSLRELADKFKANPGHLSLIRNKQSGRHERPSIHYLWLLLREHISRKGRRQGGTS